MKHRTPGIALPQNWLDKAIAWVSPAAAVRRGQARGMLAISGGYTGARMDRAQLAAWRTRAGSPDADIIPDLPKLRERSRDLARNAPVATGAINTTVISVVGTGLSCNPQVDAAALKLSPEAAAAWQADTRRRFKAWAESQDCDISRTLTFYGVQDLAFRAAIESGDAFVLTPRVQRPGKPAALALQLLEADRVCTPKGMGARPDLVEGIEYSLATGEAVAYHIASTHPGDITSAPLEWRRVEARGGRSGRRNVLHLFKPTRPGQKRGVPMLAPIIEPLKQISRYTDAELQAAVTSGLFSVFFRMDPQAFQDLFDNEGRSQYIDRAAGWSGEIESGKAVNLLPGEEPVTVNPGRPNAQFDPFMQSLFTQVGMALGIPVEVLTQRFQSSYSAARGALLQAWKFFNTWRDWLATHLCQPVYETWLAEEIAAGRINAPGFFSSELTRHAWAGCQWVGDGPGSLDPGKEVAAARDRVALGTSTLQAESILHDGVDWETKHQQQVKEAQARREAGFLVHGAAPPAPVAAAEPEEPEPPEEPETPAGPDANTTAMVAALHAIAAREPAAPQVTIAEGAVQVHTQVDPAQVHMAPGTLQVTNQVQPAPVTVQQPGPVRQRIERDAAGELKEIITEPYPGTALN